MTYLPFGAAILIILACMLTAPRNQHRNRNTLLDTAAAHANTQTPGINYAGNPYRVGSYVYVMETGQPSEHDWHGTYIGMQDGYALIRDQATHVVASVNKDQLYSAHR